MKNILYFKKMTFHDLFTGKITTKLHCDIFGIVFRVKIKSVQPEKQAHSEWLGIN